MPTRFDTNDLALIELHKSGSTGAPSHVLRVCADRGHIIYKGNTPTLTAKGKARAVKLAGAESAIRALAANAATGTRCALTTAAGNGFHT